MGKKILLVDDDPDLLYGMNIWLRSKGYQVSLATDATSALSLAQALKPDLILLDIGLPGEDGYLTMGRLKSLLPLAPIPIVIITAADASLHQEKTLQTGAEAFFQKPIDLEQLLATIKKFLGEEPAEKEAKESQEKEILLIDDDQDLVHALRVRLKSYGFSVHSATDAVLAISLALRIKPDLIILDIGLPDGEGYLTMARLRSLEPLSHVPVIVITAADAFTHRDKALQAGAKAFFPKPIDHHQLLAAIKHALGEDHRSQ